MGLYNSFLNATIFACILIPLASGVNIPLSASNPEVDSVHGTNSASSPADTPLDFPDASSIVARSAPATSGGKRPLVLPSSSPPVPVAPGVGGPSITGLPNVSWAFVGTDGMGPGVGEGVDSAVFNHPEIVLGQGGVAPSYMSNNDYRSYWTRTYVALLRKRNPLFNYIVCYDKIEHQAQWNGTQHVDWDVSNQDVQLHSGSNITFNVYYGMQGWFKRSGDGGYTNWAYMASMDIPPANNGAELNMVAPSVVPRNGTACPGANSTSGSAADNTTIGCPA